MSKTFDKFDHLILCWKLEHYFGITSTALSLMENYLYGREKWVIIGNRQSGLRRITSGVPQGSVLGPLLFSIFVTNLFSVCRHCIVYGYAYNIQLYISNRIGLIEDTSYKLNYDLKSVLQWAEDNNLMLNCGKSYILPISRWEYDLSYFPAIYLGNALVRLNT